MRVFQSLLLCSVLAISSVGICYSHDPLDDAYVPPNQASAWASYQAKHANHDEPGLNIPDKDWDLLFRTLYGECRNQSDAEIRGIVNVVYNRWVSGYWGTNLRSVLLAPKQFSVWNKGDRSRRIIKDDSRIDWTKFTRLENIARQVFNERSMGKADSTHGATHFYHPNSMVCVQGVYRKNGKRYKVTRHLRPEWYHSGPKIRIGEAVFVRIPLE